MFCSSTVLCMRIIPICLNNVNVFYKQLCKYFELSWVNHIFYKSAPLFQLARAGIHPSGLPLCMLKLRLHKYLKRPKTAKYSFQLRGRLYGNEKYEICVWPVQGLFFVEKKQYCILVYSCNFWYVILWLNIPSLPIYPIFKSTL